MKWRFIRFSLGRGVMCFFVLNDCYLGVSFFSIWAVRTNIDCWGYIAMLLPSGMPNPCKSKSRKSSLFFLRNLLSTFMEMGPKVFPREHLLGNLAYCWWKNILHRLGSPNFPSTVWNHQKNHGHIVIWLIFVGTGKLYRSVPWYPNPLKNVLLGPKRPLESDALKVNAGQQIFFQNSFGLPGMPRKIKRKMVNKHGSKIPMFNRESSQKGVCS